MIFLRAFFSFLVFMLLGIFEHPGSMAWCLTLTWRHAVTIISNIYSVPFTLFLLVPYTFCSCSTALDFFFFFRLYFLCFSVSKDSFAISLGLPLWFRLVKNLPAMQATWVRMLGWEDPLEKGKAAHCRIPVWRIPWNVQSMGSQRVGHD